MSHSRPGPARGRAATLRTTVAAALAAALAAAALVALPAPAQAAITVPSNGSTVSGNVAITEATGATNGCNFLHSPNVTSRIQVTRLVDGAVVHTASKSGTGSLSTTWPSLGQPRGQFRIQSFARRAVASGFANAGCTLQSEAELSNIVVNLDNAAAVSVHLPSAVTTGESLPIELRSTVVGTGVTGQPLGDRQVTVTVDGVGDVVVTTDAGGNAQTTVPLPDLPAGPLQVTAAVTTDPFYTGLDGTASTTLTHRPTATFYRGDTRQQPGRTARLIGQLIDVTPGSTRFGDAVPNQPMTLTFEGDPGQATTNLTGRAVRTVAVTGESRTVRVEADFDGDDVYAASGAAAWFFIGDDAAEPAPIESGPGGSLTGAIESTVNSLGLGSLLGGLLGSVVDDLAVAVLDTVDSIDDLLAALGLGDEDALDDLVATLDSALHLLGEESLTQILGALLDPLTAQIGSSGQVVDMALDGIFAGLIAHPQWGEYVDTATFDWRSVHVDADGGRVTRQFNSIIGIPQPLDVTGDGNPDVLANLTFATGVASLGFSNVDDAIELVLDLGGDPTAVVPRLEIARLPGAPADLPLSLQAILTLPGDDHEYRFGYDTRASNAPEGFRAEVLLGDGGAALQVASRGEDALKVTGALVPSAAGDDEPGAGPDEPTGLDDEPSPDTSAPAEQRFAVGFSTAPSSARIAIDLGSGAADQQLAAALSTEEPTLIGLEFVDDTGGDRTFIADGLLDSVDGTLGVSLAGSADDGLAAELRSDKPLDAISLRARTLEAGAVVDDIRLGLFDVPDTISFVLGADGSGELTTSAPIGIFEAGYASGREIALLEDESYLHLIADADTQSIALRLPGFEGMALSLGDQIGVALTMAPTPLRALVDQDGLLLDAHILDAPRQLGIGLSADGEIEVSGSAPIELVTVQARNDDGLFSGATDVDLRLEQIPSLLRVGIEESGVVFETGGDPIGLLELHAHSGDPVTVPGGGDGLFLRSGPEALTLAGRIEGLRGIEASLGDTPDVLLDTVAGNIFTVLLQDVDGAGTVTNETLATLDRLVPNMRLALSDVEGALLLNYSADEPTTSLSFEMGGLSGSIGNPLPTELLVCMADDEACLPQVGIEDPSLGSIRFAGSDYTTINLDDDSGGLSAENLRVRVLELTGELDADDGGDVYLNTTEFGGDCGAAGCRYPIQGGRVFADLGGAALTFVPGVGFEAVDAITHLKVDKLFGQPIGLSGTGGTGQVICVPATRLDVTVRVPILGNITLNVRDALCNVNRTG
ncbi:hypothetical protein [Nocardioides limicola]|uniref:hypothetical protein n=1 Tax=Nocardioides limicola TaxID=2803368 RepID=UPI00193BEF40|nr:hypothetical protein [Nocardioides sp. DJM-14]